MVVFEHTFKMALPRVMIGVLCASMAVWLCRPSLGPGTSEFIPDLSFSHPDLRAFTSLQGMASSFASVLFERGYSAASADSYFSAIMHCYARAYCGTGAHTLRMQLEATAVTISARTNIAKCQDQALRNNSAGTMRVFELKNGFRISVSLDE